MWAIILPSLVVLLMIASLVANYGISVSNNDVAPFWPYISDGGVLYPESNIFAQLLDMSAFAGFFTFLVRYYRILDYIEPRKVHIRRLSSAALVIGSLSVFGMTLVGNFQEDKPDHVHFVGAVLLFVLGTTYSFVDAIVSFSTLPVYGTFRLCVTRFIIAILSTIFILLALVGKFVSENAWGKKYPDQNPNERHVKQRHWNRTEPGYDIHVLGSTSEWVVGVMFILYFCTFIAEFSRIHVSLTVFDGSDKETPSTETSDNHRGRRYGENRSNAENSPLLG